ncbi:hypothetical protein HED60_03560 [Planctomycetales bacterium ZRK34]|nr:hypothetical protein HED60_03560 [Planctomycetales bacterium ZRK34]
MKHMIFSLLLGLTLFHAAQAAEPVDDINRAAVYTIHEVLQSPDDIAMAKRAGSDVWIRGWFKWNRARDYVKFAPQVQAAHEAGALFGGGVTCSALYHGENGLTEKQVLDMATRNAAGELVDAWDQRGIRHGSLSNPAYVDYVLSWCYRQIDQGVDYLFMDEINAALDPDEGFDDYSLRDFAAYLKKQHDWPADDTRWQQQFKIDDISKFDYRAYLRKHGLIDNPYAMSNPLRESWNSFRRDRDDRVWHTMVDRLRDYAKSKQRRVYISGNGLARYVDLQVLGVWGLWRVDDRGRVDLSESQMDAWAATVQSGRSLVGRRVPVVLFHDWGMDGYPWIKVTPAERKAWMRIRAAEIYAAGGFFAFPVRGPWGPNAQADGTLDTLIHQTGFYRAHRDLYLRGELIGIEPLECDQPLMSLALWRDVEAKQLRLHVINRRVDEQWQSVKQGPVTVTLPTDKAPRRVRLISPDFEGERVATASVDHGQVKVTLPAVEAYTVAVLEYDTLPTVRMHTLKTSTSGHWRAADESEFHVKPDGMIANGGALNGYVHGKLHPQMSNPPTFITNMTAPCTMKLHVLGVSSAGARLRLSIDGKLEKTIDLPDRDRRNDAYATEYDETFTLNIPAGEHRISLTNDGGDWAFVSWYSFDKK